MNEANILKYTDEANGQNTVDKFSWVGAPIFTKKDSERRPIERESTSHWMRGNPPHVWRPMGSQEFILLQNQRKFVWGTHL